MRFSHKINTFGSYPVNPGFGRVNVITFEIAVSRVLRQRRSKEEVRAHVETLAHLPRTTFFRLEAVHLSDPEERDFLWHYRGVIRYGQKRVASDEQIERDINKIYERVRTACMHKRWMKFPWRIEGGSPVNARPGEASVERSVPGMSYPPPSATSVLSADTGRSTSQFAPDGSSFTPSNSCKADGTIKEVTAFDEDVSHPEDIRDGNPVALRSPEADGLRAEGPSERRKGDGSANNLQEHEAVTDGTPVPVGKVGDFPLRNDYVQSANGHMPERISEAALSPTGPLRPLDAQAAFLMDGPKFIRFFDPLIKALKTLGGSGRPPEVFPIVAQLEGVSEEEKSELLKCGTSRFENQVAWARQYLVWSGHIDSSERGVWSLTQAGQATSTVTRDEAAEIFKKEHSLHPRSRSSDLTGGSGHEEVLPETEPDDLSEPCDDPLEPELALAVEQSPQKEASDVSDDVLESDPPEAQRLQNAAEVLKNVSDATRLGILLHLKKGERNVTELLSALKAQSQPAVSHHLALLRHAHLVEQDRRGKHIYYRLTEKGQALATIVEKFI
jgi:DNA-binding transcriptional ArsR family regulator